MFHGARWKRLVCAGFLACAGLASTVTIPAADLSVTATYSMLTTDLDEARILLFDDYALTNHGTPPTCDPAGHRGRPKRPPRVSPRAGAGSAAGRG